METSETMASIATALAKYHTKAEAVTRDKRNPHFKNDYATLDNILDTTRPLLAEVGISVIQLPVGESGLTTMLLHESGEFIRETYIMPAKSNDPQGNGSRLTYQRRYALGAILGIATEQDDDGNEASKPNASYQQAANSTTPELPWLNQHSDKEKTKESDAWKRTVIAVTSGVANKDTGELKVWTIDDLKKHYKISKEVQASLESVIKNYKQ